MRLYDNAPDSYHDELASYFPAWYSGILEMDAIWSITGDMLDELKQDILKVLNNTFVRECGIETIERLERYFGVKFDGPRSEAERRRFLMMMFTGFGKCSASSIKTMIREYTEAETEVTFRVSDTEGNHTLHIDVDRGDLEKFYPSDILTMLEKMIPAHIQYSMRTFFGTRIQANVTRTYWLFSYDQAGIQPDTSTLGRAQGMTASYNTDIGRYTYAPAAPSPNQAAGVIPNGLPLE
ncbi:MAG: DUF2313 domain-containing protein [Alphaproteobacteria bacterium]|nr:DUF2313 domain-containing protein [Alphaproteobacteria bacterium]